MHEVKGLCAEDCIEMGGVGSCWKWIAQVVLERSGVWKKSFQTCRAREVIRK